MILEIGGKFPWIRRWMVPIPQPIPLSSAPTHQSWVQTAEGLGWLVRHDPEGFTVQLQDGRQILTKNFQKADAP